MASSSKKRSDTRKTDQNTGRKGNAGRKTVRKTAYKTSGRTASGGNRKKPGKKQGNNRDVIIAVVLVLLAIAVTGLALVFSGGLDGFLSRAGAGTRSEAEEQDMSNTEDDGRPPLDVQLLTPNDFSRPQIAMDEINGIVIHYTANPGASAQQNHDYFENLKDSAITHASSHFIIGLDGEIIQCIPSTEIAYASNGRNYDTLSIECCHPDDTGAFTDATYDSLVELTAWCCRHFDIPADGVIRHYDITEKICPKYFVEHEDAWEQFLKDVKARIEEEKTNR